MNKDFELELAHKTLIKEEIEKGTFKATRELPKEIRDAMKGLDFKIGKYNKKLKEADVTDEDAVEKLNDDKDDIETKSVEIADEIQNWIEKDLPEPDDDDKKDDKKDDTAAKTDDKKDDTAIKTDDKKDDDTATGTAKAEKLIVDALNKDGKIYSSDLKKILEVKSIEEIPDVLQVGKTKLKRILAFYYKAD